MVDKITRPRWLARFVRWFGRRGLILGLAGTAWMVNGFIFATDKVERFSRDGPGGPLALLDTNPWPGVLWMACGAMAFIIGHVRRRFGGEDALGFAALTAPVIVWIIGYAWSYSLYIYSAYIDPVPDDVIGRSSASAGFVVYLMILGFLFIIARWPDPIDAIENARYAEAHPPRQRDR
jgi:hypothetical protein